MFRVDPELLTGAVGSIEDAAGKLAGAKEMLEGIHRRLQSSSTLSQDGKADDKFDGFHDRWKDEFGILADMMKGFKDALGSTAEVYTTADQEIAKSFLPQAEA